MPISTAVDYGSIELDGMRFKVEGAADEDIVNIHARKVNQGDPGPDDHPINSTWIQSDWTGGGQVHVGTPDVVTGRFDFAIGETMQAKTITLPPKPDNWDDPAASGNDSMMLGTYNNKVWAAWGDDIRFYNSGADTWDDLGTNLTTSPETKGITWTPSFGPLAGSNIFCIPLGPSFDYVNGSAVTNVALSAVDLIVHDSRLWRIGQSGELQWTNDLVTWSTITYIPDGSSPRQLDVYLTVGGDPTIYVTTNAGVWVYDDVSGSLLQSQLQYPRHPDQGRASCVWRGELYTSVGDGVHRYNRSTIAAQGLDRDDGLPFAYRGVIVDLEPSYNAIYALVSSIPVYPATESVDPYILHAGDDSMVADGSTTTNILMKWNGFGWHFVAQVFGTAASTCIVSDAENDYGVWFAAYRQIWRIRLNRSYMNLKDDLTGPVVPEAWFETAWYNFGWEGQTKVLKNFDIFLEAPGDAQSVDIFYKLEDDDHNFVHLGTARALTLSDETNFYFGLDSGADPNSTDPNDYHGMDCNRVKFRFEMHQGNAGSESDKPIIKWFTVSARKMLRPVRSFRVVLNLDKVNGYPSQEQREKLLYIIREPRAFDFVYQNEVLKVDVVALSFRSRVDATSVMYTCKINLIESFETLIPFSR